MSRMTFIIITCSLWTISRACLPIGPMMGVPPPAYGGFYRPPMPYQAGLPAYGGMPGMTPFGLGPRVGPFRSEASTDQLRSVSVLNCASFESECKWSNTNEEELDWSTVKATPNSQQWMMSLGTTNYPEPAAGALVSAQRRGWEGGQLISDALPCISKGLRVTVTAWKSRSGEMGDQPKLQVCSKNANEARLPLVNCKEIDVQNGVPVSADVPVPNDQNMPAQIVLYGNNFVATEGGAIFVQDIQVEGRVDCGGDTFESHPTLLDQLPPTKSENSRSIGPLRALEGVGAQLEAIDAPAFDQSRPVKAPPPPSLGGLIPRSAQAFPSSNDYDDMQSISGRLEGTPLFEQCLSLSCNPSDLSCNFWRSSGNNRWEIGSKGRVSNPLTGIHLPPGPEQKFLVAPFYDPRISSYTLVSEKLNVPLTEEVYFCFYEYLATHGLSLSICTETNDCFYRKNSLSLGNDMEENKIWNVRCTRLPPGNYELRVVAENMGSNKGEIGFLPIRLSRDPKGEHFIC